ncbi:hypothetical protein bcere0025_11020 [Bacillus cereus F65185]|nr:hypothetical protein bcere0025_11020 [Bacillus cereus F65185]
MKGKKNKIFKKVLTCEKSQVYNECNLKNASVDEEEYT